MGCTTCGLNLRRARDFPPKWTDQLWGPPSFLFQGYLELFPQG